MNNCEYRGGSYHNGEMAIADANDLCTFSIDDSLALINAFAQGAFLSTNDDLNSFFTPGLDGPNKSMVFLNPIEPSHTKGQWEAKDGSQRFIDLQEYPFPTVQSQSYMQQDIDSNSTMNANVMRSQYYTPAELEPLASVAEEQPQSPINIEKPKRGRPRKRKRKVLSEEERQRKREAFLERNRRAASKCRKRKKESIENIQARANILNNKSRVLLEELALMRAECAKWLKLAIEHTKSCLDDFNLQECINAAETRLAELSNFVPMSRSETWDEHLSDTRGEEEGSIISDLISLRDTNTCKLSS